MKVFVRILALMLILTAIVAISCSDRGTNTGDELVLAEGGPLNMNHVFADELLTQIKNPYQILEMVAYQPKVSFPVYAGGLERPVPMLILLPPQGKDHLFYFNHGLEEIADELIASGQIQPMYIVCIANDPVFGGYFFGSRYAGAGNYDAIFSESLLEYAYTACPYAINEPSKRAIGGVGQGAYGAFRAALLNPGTFCSISAVDGPLDFDGQNGSGGFVPLFTDALNEQGILGGTTDPPTTQTTYWVCNAADPITSDCIDSTQVTASDAYDFTHIQTVWPASWRQMFDSSSTTPFSNMLIGASLAFSPHDTAVQCSVVISNDGLNRTIMVLSRDQVSDTMTLIPNVVKSDERNFDFHLPFDSTGALYSPIWDNYWLPNNLETLLAGSTLDGVNMWIATSEEARFGYHDQTASWITTLQSAGYPVTTITYSGYDGRPAETDEYVYDLLKEMLIFHSECFGN